MLLTVLFTAGSTEAKSVISKTWSLTASAGYRDTNPSYASTPPSTAATITVNPSLSPTATIKNTIADGIAAIVAHGSLGSAPLVLEIQSPVPGVLYEYQEGIRIVGVNAGSWANALTIRVRSGDKVRLKASDRAAGDRFAFYSSASLYWKLDGGTDPLNPGFYFGNRGEWTPPSAVTRSKGDTFFNDKQIYVTGASMYFRMQGFDMPGANDYEMSQITRDCKYFTLAYFNAELAGCNVDNPDDGFDYGELLQNLGQRCIIHDARLIRGGHDTLSMMGPFQITRSCYFDADWRGYGTSQPGARAMLCSPNGKKWWNPSSTEPTLVGPNLVENNEYHGIANGDEYGQDMVFKLEGTGIIGRNNACWSQTSEHGRAHLMGQLFAIGNLTIFCSGDNALYHNSYWNFDGFLFYSEFYDTVNPATASRQNGRNFIIKNNLSANTKTDEWRPYVIYWGQGYSLSGTDFSNWFRGTEIWANGFEFASGQPATSRQVFCSEGTFDIEDSTSLPANLLNNAVGTITYADDESETWAGLVLQSGSLGYNAAIPETYTTTTTTAGNTVTVAHPFCFYHAPEWFDDAGTLTEFAEQSDYIRIETNSGYVERQITSFDRSTGVIGFGGAPVTVASGAGIWWAGNPALGATGYNPHWGVKVYA